jgi:hypothetical protein
MKTGFAVVQISDLNHNHNYYLLSLNYSHDSHDCSYDYSVSNPHETDPFFQYWNQTDAAQKMQMAAVMELVTEELLQQDGVKPYGEIHV